MRPTILVNGVKNFIPRANFHANLSFNLAKGYRFPYPCRVLQNGSNSRDKIDAGGHFPIGPQKSATSGNDEDDHLDPLNRIATVVTLGLSRSMQNQPPERSPDNPGR